MLHLKRRSVLRAAFLAFAAVLLAALISACGKNNNDQGAQPSGSPSASASQDPGKPIATYKGGEVTQAEFDRFMFIQELTNPTAAMYMQIPQYKEQSLRRYAVSEVMAARASDKQKQDAEKTASDFEKNLNDAVGKQAALKDELKKRNITVADLKSVVKVLVCSDAILSAKNTEFKNAVKDADIKAEFDKKPSDYNIATVRHILITTSDPQTGAQKRTDAEALKLAKEAKGKLEKGSDWNAIAKQYSEDPGSKDKGGLYEKTEVKTWVPEFKDAANKQVIGKIGEPVKVSYGYHVIKVESREVMTYPKLPKASKDKIAQSLIDPKMKQYMQDEEKAIGIKVTLPPAPSPSPSASGSTSAVPSASASPSANASAGK